ncbi:MAG: cytochrome P450, partial [Dehalococcoidia bacterium]
APGAFLPGCTRAGPVPMASYQPNLPASQANPYPALSRLRREQHVYRSAELQAWILTSYAACDAALHDDETFSSDPAHASGGLGDSVRSIRAAVPLGSAPILGNSDPPDHTRLRAIVNRAFTPRAMTATRPAVEAMVSRALAGAGARPEVMAALAEPVVIAAVQEHLGIPEQDRQGFRQAAMAILRARSEGPTYNPAAEAGYRDLSWLLEERWQSAGIPTTTVLGTLIEAASKGERITTDETLMLLIHISTAGNGPTACAIGNLALALAEHPEVQDLARSDPTSLPSIVEESLRFDSPTHVVARFARRDTSLGGRTIRAGDTAYCVIGAANRDPDRFRRPDDFQADRKDNRHLSFGMASHFCLGAPLARMELEVVLAQLLETLHPFRLAAFERGGTFLLRGPKAITLERA